MTSEIGQMDIAALKLNWEGSSKSTHILCSIARSIGYVLYQQSQNEETLRQLRNWLAEVAVEGDLHKGLVLGLVELVDGYRDAFAKKAEEASQALVLLDQLCTAVAQQLAKKPLTLTGLVIELGYENTEIGHALEDLQKVGLVDPPGKDQKFHLSLAGKAALSRLSER